MPTYSSNLKSPSYLKPFHLLTSHTRWQSDINIQKPQSTTCSWCWTCPHPWKGTSGAAGGGSFLVNMHISFVLDVVLKTDHKCTLTRSSAPFILPSAQRLLSLVWWKMPGAWNIINIKVNVRADEYVGSVCFCWPKYQSIGLMYC